MIGMLWFDNNPKTDLGSKIQVAVDYYLDKYGLVANRCFVHPSMIPADELELAGVKVQAHKSVLPNHFWVGVAREVSDERNS